jgi:nitrogen regulatory protein PII
MQQVNKVEIIISTLELREVTDILDSLQVSGYTVIENVSGKGRRGVVYNDLGRVFSNSYITTVCTQEKQISYLIGDILPILKKIGGVCLVTKASLALSDKLSNEIDCPINVMQEVKKVEIILRNSHIEDALKILDSVMVSGYTVLNNTSGKGDRGLSDSDIDYSFSGNYIMTVCTNERQLESLVEKITPILKKVGGVCLVTDAKWVNH